MRQCNVENKKEIFLLVGGMLFLLKAYSWQDSCVNKKKGPWVTRGYPSNFSINLESFKDENFMSR